tara:strand:+ start:48087 stop:49079 length:993 start_codon:yes stop_codon:yes gene_type:complete
LGDSVRAASIGSAVLERKGVLGKGLGFLIDLSLIIVCGILLSRLVWIVLAPASVVDLPDTSRNLSDRVDPGLIYQANPRILTEFNPFDRFVVETVEVVEEDAPETTLNLSIASIWASNDADSTFARIRRPDNSVGKFSVGDTVVSGVTIDRILSDRVILIRNGQREALYVSEMRVLGAVTPEGQPSIDPSPPSRLPSVGESGSTVSALNRSQNQQDRAPDNPGEPDLISSKSVTLGSLDEFNTAIDVLRRMGDDGRPEMVVTANTSADILDLVSIAPGDVLVSVNGRLFSEETPAELYEAMQQERVLTFVLRRGSQDFTRIITIEPGVGD